MGRTAHDPGKQASRFRLLIGLAVLTACAKVQPPPGGPPDSEPPVLLTATPDSGSAIPGFSDAAVFQFDEIVAEQNLDQFVRVSPRHEDIRVTWRRRRVTVRPGDNWLPNTVYFITILPGISDLRNNKSEDEHNFVFTTGDALPTTEVTGIVVNWETGQRARDGLVEAIRISDSLSYITRTDSLGAFSFSMLPPDQYALIATIDGNRNDRRGFREPFDSTLLDLADTAVDTLWTARRDTVGPKVTEISFIDSMTVAVRFDQTLDTIMPTVESFTLLELPDSNASNPDRIISRDVFLEERAALDAIDSAEVATDSAAPIDTAPPLPPRAAPAIDQIEDPLQEEPEVESEDLLITVRPPLINEVILTLATPLKAGTRYWIEGVVRNIAGASETSGRQLSVPEPTPEPDP